MITKSFADTGYQIKVFPFSDGKSLIEKIEKGKQIFDIIFLDVDMPVIHGFQVAQRLRELHTTSLLLFTTYLEHQSREGYLYGAFRYVFKNNLEKEITEAVSGIIKKLDNSIVDQEEVTFRCRVSGVLEDLTLRQADILFLEKEKTRRVTLKTIYLEYELLVKPLSEYAGLLNSSVFVPIMRSYLLNFNHVESIQDGFFVLTNGLTVPLGVKREVRKVSMEKYLKFLEGRI
jgi:DNA-binding LytR/AlgR family response regulator